MTHLISRKQITVEDPRGLYHWAKIFNRLQREFFVEPTKLRREKQIEDFIRLNGCKKVKFKTDTDLFNDLTDITQCKHSRDADIVVISDQKFSRYPCPVIIDLIKQQLNRCPNLYLCLNRHYINIDNSYHDPALDNKFTVAISQWLRKELYGYDVLDLSLDFLDYGQSFTWAVPDRHFFIRKL